MSSWKRVVRPALIAAAATALAAAALITIPSAGAATGDGSTTDPNITYVGRWNKSSAAFYQSNWAGSYLRTGFTGTTVKLKQRNVINLYVSVDGSAFKTFDNVSGTVNVTPSGLKAGNHTLVVSYRQVAGSYKGDAGFGGLVLDAGAKTFAVPVRPQLVEWVGDSITAGATSSQLAVTDYAFVASEQIGVEHTQIAIGGMCLAELTAAQSTRGVACWGQEGRYFTQNAVLGSAAWDFSKYQADAVVINLGTNDKSHGVSGADFQAKYTTFLTNIRAKYPKAALLALETFSKRYAAETQAAVKARNAAGDANVFYINSEGWLPADGSGLSDSVHPNDKGHLAIAAKIGPIVKSHLASVPSSPPPTKTYKLVNRQSGKVLSIAGASTADGAAAVQATDNGSAIQHWQVVDLGGGYSKLVNVGSGKDLDVSAKSAAEGAAIIQYRDNGGTNQQWTVTSSGGYSKVVSRLSGKALDVTGSSTADGAALIQSTDVGSADQQWQLVAV
jgi:hypothetical protein